MRYLALRKLLLSVLLCAFVLLGTTGCGLYDDFLDLVERPLYLDDWNDPEFQVTHDESRARFKGYEQLISNILSRHRHEISEILEANDPMMTSDPWMLEEAYDYGELFSPGLTIMYAVVVDNQTEILIRLNNFWGEESVSISHSGHVSNWDDKHKNINVELLAELFDALSGDGFTADEIEALLQDAREYEFNGLTELQNRHHDGNIESHVHMGLVKWMEYSFRPAFRHGDLYKERLELDGPIRSSD